VVGEFALFRLGGRFLAAGEGDRVLLRLLQAANGLFGLADGPVLGLNLRRQRELVPFRQGEQRAGMTGGQFAA
jgi:hypothetical protein